MKQRALIIALLLATLFSYQCNNNGAKIVTKIVTKDVIPTALNVFKIAISKGDKKPSIHVPSVEYFSTTVTSNLDLKSFDVEGHVSEWVMSKGVKKYSILVAALGTQLGKVNASSSVSNADLLAALIKDKKYSNSYILNDTTITILIESDSIEIKEGQYKGRKIHVGQSKVNIGITEILHSFSNRGEKIRIDLILGDKAIYTEEYNPNPIEKEDTVIKPIPRPDKNRMINELRILKNRFKSENKGIRQTSTGIEVEMKRDDWRLFLLYHKNGKIYKINTCPEIRAADIDFNIIDEDGDGIPEINNLGLCNSSS